MVFGLGKPNVEKMMAKGDVNGLIGVLSYNDSQIAWNAMLALINLGPPSIGPLSAAMQNISNDNIKSNLSDKLTVLALGQLGYAGAVPLLRKCTDDDIPVISKISALSLGQFGDEFAKRPLCNMLRNLDEEPNIRLSALEMLKPFVDDDNEVLYAILFAAQQDRVLGDNSVKENATKFAKKKNSK